MAIYKLIANGSFGPDEIEAMSAAYESALVNLGIVNRDDPAQRAKLETDRKAAVAELERVKKDMTDQTKAIAAIEEEARRAGVPAGWLR